MAGREVRVKWTYGYKEGEITVDRHATDAQVNELVIEAILDADDWTWEFLDSDDDEDASFPAKQVFDILEECRDSLSDRESDEYSNGWNNALDRLENKLRSLRDSCDY